MALPDLNWLRVVTSGRLLWTR